MSEDSGAGERRDLSVSMAKANLYTLVISLPPTMLLATVYLGAWGIGAFDGVFGWMYSGLPNFLAVLAVFVLGVVAHEGIHGLSWAYFAGKPLRSIEFGFQARTLTPYAHCKEPMEARAYRLGAAMPGLLLGLLPAAVGLATGSAGTMAFGLFFTFAAGGDFLVLWLIRDVEGDALVEDHPTNAGCFVHDSR